MEGFLYVQEKRESFFLSFFQNLFIYYCTFSTLNKVQNNVSVKGKKIPIPYPKYFILNIQNIAFDLFLLSGRGFIAASTLRLAPYRRRF